MCIIAVVPKKHPIPTFEERENSWENNPHGFGIMAVHEGVIKVSKTLDKNEMHKLFKEYSENYGDKSFLVAHYRAASKGSHINLENCHPFAVNDMVAFVHNGFLTPYPIGKDGVSDTAQFANALGQLLFDWQDNLGVWELIQAIAGVSKLVFMFNDGNVYIVNKEAGHYQFPEKKHSIWWSNLSYEKVFKPEIVIHYFPRADDYHEGEKKLRLLADIPKEKEYQFNGTHQYLFKCSKCNQDKEKAHDDEWVRFIPKSWYINGKPVCPECQGIEWDNWWMGMLTTRGIRRCNSTNSHCDICKDKISIGKSYYEVYSRAWSKGVNVCDACIDCKYALEVECNVAMTFGEFYYWYSDTLTQQKEEVH